MKTRLIATLTALSLTAYAGTAARADESGVTPEWQKPGYVMEVVTVTATRPEFAPEIGTDAAVRDESIVTTDVTPAWQEPGYEMEVITVTASRSELPANDRFATRRAAHFRSAVGPRRPAWSAMGLPVR